MTEIKPGNGKPDVILLNGPSSAGKSSIAKALRQLLLDSGANAVILSLDDYLQMSTNEPIWEDDVFAIIPRMCADIRAALQDGKTVIIDHVITSARIYGALSHAVAGFQMKTVLVRCDVETLRRREANGVTGVSAPQRYLPNFSIQRRNMTCVLTAATRVLQPLRKRLSGP